MALPALVVTAGSFVDCVKGGDSRNYSDPVKTWWSWKNVYLKLHFRVNHRREAMQPTLVTATHSDVVGNPPWRMYVTKALQTGASITYNLQVFSEVKATG